MKPLMMLAILLSFFLELRAQGSGLPYILQDQRKLVAFKRLYLGNNQSAREAIDSLRKAADKALEEGPFSVTFHKLRLAPSGDKHDYVSQAPYWWPDSSRPGGKPYIRKDGHINPERNESKDYGQLGQTNSNIKLLALSYYFTNDDRYAKKAVELMKTWFMDTATRMNPNLNYGQYVPGINEGRGIGIIETAGLTNIPDALAMLQQSSELKPAVITGMKNWFKEYLTWLLDSRNGKDERSQKNNHGTYYDMQVADFALFTGNSQLAARVINEQTIPRMDQQFAPDGSEPLELVRTKSWGYATMNLTGWCKLAVIANKVNIDLWHQKTKDGKGIQRVFEWLMPYMLQEKTWNYEQIEPYSVFGIAGLYKLAKSEYPAGHFDKVLTFYANKEALKPWW
jgi:hypothetical protein